jgi:environmental stress-induced protein Ves
MSAGRSDSGPGAAGDAALLLVAADDVTPVAWKNGGGVTRELLRVARPGAPPGEDWLLRISLADIAADGPFSPFPGIARAFAVIEGAGVRLRWPATAARPARERLVQAGDAPLDFDGADAPDCHLLDGPTRDLNVMVRAAAARAELALAPPGHAWTGPAGARGVFALCAITLRREGRPPVELAPRTLAWCAEGDTRPWSIVPAPGAGAGMAQTGVPPSRPGPVALRIGVQFA